MNAYISAGDIIWGSIAGALTGLCGVLFFAITAHFFVKEGFSAKSLKLFFVDGKKKELLSWIALFIENYPMVFFAFFSIKNTLKACLQVYILFTCLNEMVFGHVLDKSTQNHCSAIFSSKRVMFQTYFGLATSWLSITKNLVAFEENNYVKTGQQIRIFKKLFLFFKVSPS